MLTNKQISARRLRRKDKRALNWYVLRFSRIKKESEKEPEN
jgi:hypothetical protein